MIYLDNAATSYPKPESVYEAIDGFNRRIGANPGRSGYATARQAAQIVAETRGLLAQLLHVDDPNQIVFTTNATEALNLGLKGLLRQGDHVVTTVTEHNSVVRPLHSLVEQREIEVTWVECDSAGLVDPGDVGAVLRPDTRMVCMTHASNVTGAVHDVQAVGSLVQQNGALLMVDAAQTAGCWPIDVNAMQVDLLAFTGHKALMGPQGTGGLYIRSGLEHSIQPLREGGTGSFSSSGRQPEKMPDRFEGGTHNTPGLAGLGAGIRFALETEVNLIQEHEESLVAHLLDRLASVPGIEVYGPTPGSQRLGVVSFTLREWPPLNLAHLLASAFDIATRSGLHCAPLVHRYIGTADTGTIRVSIGFFNTRSDLDALCDALSQVTQQE